MSTHLSEIARPTPRMAQVVPWGRHPGLLSKIGEGFAESSAAGIRLGRSRAGTPQQSAPEARKQVDSFYSWRMTPDVRHVVAAWQRVERSRESPS